MYYFHLSYFTQTCEFCVCVCVCIREKKGRGRTKFRTHTCTLSQFSWWTLAGVAPSVGLNWNTLHVWWTGLVLTLLWQDSTAGIWTQKRGIWHKYRAAPLTLILHCLPQNVIFLFTTIWRPSRLRTTALKLNNNYVVCTEPMKNYKHSSYFYNFFSIHKTLQSALLI